ncbi:hypothetical protein D3C87_1033290 [compost metagenome]
MADEVPPVETEPFDPIFNTLIHFKCPGFNQRNTFREEGQIIACGNGFSGPKITSLVKNWNRCSKVYPIAAEQVVKRTCNTVRSTDSMTGNLKHFSNPFLCKLPSVMTESAVLKRGARCKIIFTKVAEAFKVNTCRFGAKITLADSFITKRVCRRKHSVEDVVTMRKFRRLCGTFPLATFDARWACKELHYADIDPEVIRLISNLGRCRIPAILDTSLYVATKICVRMHLTDNVINEFGTKAPRVGGFTCKVYPLNDQNFNGKKLCNVIKLIPLEDNFKYKGTEARFSCKVYPVMNIDGRRWRCGTILLTMVDMRVFGRIWGGRPENNTFIRVDGRMIGKLR